MINDRLIHDHAFALARRLAEAGPLGFDERYALVAEAMRAYAGAAERMRQRLHPVGEWLCIPEKEDR